ncbi:translocator protein-like protein [Phlyctochytrium arcticum]|nr:translocator protein-like protein [Phlyctochytrium arcticum]
MSYGESTSVLSLINRPLIVAVGTPLILGIGSGLVTKSSIKTWYPTVNKPSWTPPNWVFAPVWTALYTGMGYASYRVYRQGQLHPFLDVTTPLRLYAAQLALNMAWTPLFFGVHQLGLASLDIVALLGTVIATAREFGAIDEVAGWLMVPYAAWVAYAGSITLSVWWNNRGKPGVDGAARKKL